MTEEVLSKDFDHKAKGGDIIKQYMVSGDIDDIVRREVLVYTYQFLCSPLEPSLGNKMIPFFSFVAQNQVSDVILAIK